MIKEYTSRMAILKVAKFLDTTVGDAKYLLEVDLTGSCSPRFRGSCHMGESNLQNQANKILRACGWDISGGALFSVSSYS